MTEKPVWKWYRVDWMTEKGFSRSDFWRARSKTEAMEKQQSSIDVPMSIDGSGKPRFINIVRI